MLGISGARNLLKLKKTKKHDIPGSERSSVSEV